jgi:hypothetical protein
MASMGRIERQLLNEALIGRGLKFERPDSEQRESYLTITEARALLPESQQREIRLRARNLAWRSLVPEETFDRNPLPEAVRISDTIAHIQDHLQERARVAQTVRNDFVAGKIHSREIELEKPKIDQVSSQVIKGRPEQFVQPVSDSLSPADVHKLAELDLYAAQTREDIYRAFELLDVQRRNFELARAHDQSLTHGTNVRPRIVQAQAERLATVGTERSQAMPLDKLIPVVAPEPQHVKAEIQSEKPLVIISSSRVQSDQEWHFDSLREVLGNPSGLSKSDTPSHNHLPYQQADHDFVQER